MNNTVFKLSTHSVAVFALILQKGILERKDIFPMFKELQLVPNENGELDVINPPRGLDIDAILRERKERKSLEEKNDEEKE
ncbi:MAG: hypothetical protein QXO70_04245 [Candidatus Pacearchaeota archaeon]